MNNFLIKKKELLFLSGTMLAMIAVRLTMIASDFDPAYDQSMLLANFPLDNPSDILRPLHYFEQTTTLGHGLLMDLSARIFGSEGMARVNAIRLVGVFALCASLLWLYVLLRRELSFTEALLSVVLIGSSPLMVSMSITAKHYVFEFAATVVLLGATLHYIRQPTLRRGLVVVIAGFFAALFAFVAPIIVAAIGAATLVAQAVDARQRDVPTHQLLRGMAGTLALGAALALIVAGFYFGYTSIVTENDLTAFSGRDAKKFIEVDNLFSQQSIRNVVNYASYFAMLVEIGGPYEIWGNSAIRTLFAATALVLSIVGVMALRKRSPFWVAAAIATLVFTLALNLAQSFPFSGARQHLFAAPLVAPLIVVGFVSLVRSVASRLAIPRAANVFFSALVLASILMSGFGISNKESVVPRLLDKIGNSKSPVWAHYGAQPILRTLRPTWMTKSDGLVEGLLLHHTGNQRWNFQARSEDDNGLRPDYYATAVEAISQHEKLWLIFSNWWFDVSQIEGLEMFLQHARGPGRDCAIWQSANSTLVAFCGPQDEVNSLRERNSPDHTAEWNLRIQPGDWNLYVKGETGELLRRTPLSSTPSTD